MTSKTEDSPKPKKAEDAPKPRKTAADPVGAGRLRGCRDSSSEPRP